VQTALSVGNEVADHANDNLTDNLPSKLRYLQMISING